LSQKQCTLKNSVEITGVGLHTGEETVLRLKPAPVDHGVVFVRVDLPGKPTIKVCPQNITTRLRRTCIAQNGAEVQTIEHLLSCLTGLGIDNIEIEIDTPEIPGADGSALPFIEKLNESGKVEQDVERHQINLAEPILVHEGDLSLVALPADDGLSISYNFEWWSDYGDIDSSAEIFSPQHFSLSINEDTYTSEIAPARTFVAGIEAEKLREMGMGKGANYKNTLVVGLEGIIKNKLRFKDEFVRHKILDLLGDISLLGGQLNAKLVAVKSGHSLNMKLVEAIQKQLDGQAESGPVLRGVPIDIRQIQKILPHRYPFLLVDRVLELEDSKRAVGIKNVTINEPFFTGHFPGVPVMPGVLQIEAMAQIACIMLVRQLTEENKLAMLLSLDKVKLRKTVVPGDQLLLESEAVRIKKRTGEVKTKASVDGKVVAEAQIRFMIVDASSL